MKLGMLIKKYDKRNVDLITENNIGVTKEKNFISSVANTIGTDLSKYKLLDYNVFACNPMHVGRDKALPIGLYKGNKDAIVSPAYFTFKVCDENVLLPDYLMMWFKLKQTDHIIWFHTDGSVRGGISWEDLCNLEINVPNLEKQKEIVFNYNELLRKFDNLKEENLILENLLNKLFYNTFLNINGNNNIKETALGKIKSNYEVVKLKDIILKVIDNRGKTPLIVENGKPLLEGMHISMNDSFPDNTLWDKQKYVSQEDYDNWFRAGHPLYHDIMCATVGTLPKWCMMDNQNKYCIAQNIIALRTNEKASQYYLLGYMNTKKFINEFNSRIVPAVQPSIKVPHMLDIDIILPPKNEIDLYSQKVDSIYKKIELNKYKIGEYSILIEKVLNVIMEVK